MSKKLNYILGLLVLALTFSLFKSCNTNQQLSGLYENQMEELRVTRNKFGQEVSKMAVLESDNKQLFLQMKTKDSSIIELQRLVKDARGKLKSASILKNETVVSGSGTTVVEYDTIVISPDTIERFPIYKYNWTDQWSSGTIRATKDSTNYDFKVFNQFNIVQSKVGSGLFSKRKSIIEVTNLNPYTETRSLQTFNVTCKCNNGKYFIGGALTALLITKALN